MFILRILSIVGLVTVLLSACGGESGEQVIEDQDLIGNEEISQDSDPAEEIDQTLDDEEGVDPDSSFLITTVSSEGGNVSPTSASVIEGGTFSFSIEADAGFELSSISGCNGVLEDGLFTTASITEPCQVVANFQESGS